MNQEVKTLWLEWMENPESLQHQGALGFRDFEGRESFCCLGGLCDIAEKRSVVQRSAQQKLGERIGFIADREDSEGFSPFEESSYLPESVQAWAGLDSQDPRVSLTKEKYLSFGNEVVDWEEHFEERDSTLITLSELNDTLGFSLPQIAVLVREQL